MVALKMNLVATALLAAPAACDLITNIDMGKTPIEIKQGGCNSPPDFTHLWDAVQSDKHCPGTSCDGSVRSCSRDWCVAADGEFGSVDEKNKYTTLLRRAFDVGLTRQYCYDDYHCSFGSCAKVKYSRETAPDYWHVNRYVDGRALNGFLRIKFSIRDNGLDICGAAADAIQTSSGPILDKVPGGDIFFNALKVICSAAKGLKRGDKYVGVPGTVYHLGNGTVETVPDASVFWNA